MNPLLIEIMSYINMLNKKKQVAKGAEKEKLVRLIDKAYTWYYKAVQEVNEQEDKAAGQ